MPRIVADRFVGVRDAWFDLATGSPVALRIVPAGPSRMQFDWNARCEVLANLRHPLINPLVDYGVADRDHVFEAYAIGEAVRAGGAAGGALLAHAARFLQRYQIELSPELTRLIVRPVVAGRSPTSRPLGVFLQRRSVFEAIADALDTASPGGTSGVAVEGWRGCGLRTLRLAAARAARLRGYVPVSEKAIQRFPWLIEHVLDRHVCVLGSDGAPVLLDRAVLNLLSRLATAGARRHLLLAFARPGAQEWPRVVRVDSMGVTAMAGMVFVDSETGPSSDEIFAAARAAEGRPGVCLERLGLYACESNAPATMYVHESPQPYEPTAPHARVPPRPTRAGGPGVMQRSFARADALARRGRHAAADRVLARATRVFEARGERDDGARAHVLLGWFARDRARGSAAVSHFERARELAVSPAVALAATIGIANTRTDAGSLVDAEAALRTVVLAAGRLDDPALLASAASSLARALFWRGHWDEALSVLGAVPQGAPREARVLVMESRARMAAGLIPASVRAAREAVHAAGADPRTQAAAYRTLAAAVAAAGDRDSAARHIADGIRIATAAHLPLAVIRLRLTAADIQVPNSSRSGLARLLARRRDWPRLLHFYARAVHARVGGREMDAETRAFIGTSGAVAIGRAAGAPPANPVADLEAFLDLAHSAPDDHQAVERIAQEVQARLRAATVLVVSAAGDRRVLALAGRPWHGDPHIAWRALGGGVSVPVEAMFEPAQAAEPLRYGGEIIGAIAVTWIAGTLIDTARATALLRVAALAAAASVRAMLDRDLPQPPAGTWDDLLGDSAAAHSLRDSIARAARAPFPVLIQGESGSGKELVARAIHRLGARRDRKFCALNCAALSDELIEAELFGHARGAFTGAVGERPGLFEEADGGTLFLDEIGELAARAQAKLLRVLQDGEVRRVGENFSRRVDVRIVAATNRRLDEEVKAGRFRADLRFRLDVVRIDVPPLRERVSDVPVLATRFWNDATARVGSRATLAPDAVAALARYDWPGNVRELQNVMAWMAVHSPRRGRIGRAALPSHVAHAGVPQHGSFEAAREEFERRFVKAALASAGGQRARAAEALGVTRQGLAKMMRRLRID